MALALLVLAPPAAQGQAGPRYREFELGSSLASVAQLTDLTTDQAKVIHRRPAVLSELEWRPRYFRKGMSSQTDPVDRMVFGFYDDRLYRIVVDYDPRRTEGMTQADIEAAIVASYALPSKAVPAPARAGVKYGDADQLLAMWGDADSTLSLFRVSYPTNFRLVILSNRIAELARVASTEAARLDASEAPQREIAQKQKEAADARAAEETAKRANLPAFRP